MGEGNHLYSPSRLGAQTGPISRLIARNDVECLKRRKDRFLETWSILPQATACTAAIASQTRFELRKLLDKDTMNILLSLTLFLTKSEYGPTIALVRNDRTSHTALYSRKVFPTSIGRKSY